MLILSAFGISVTLGSYSLLYVHIRKNVTCRPEFRQNDDIIGTLTVKEGVIFFFKRLVNE